MTVEQKPRTSIEPRAGERRQVTALAYDLVGSTRLAAQLDPEDLRDLQRLFHETCSKAITRYDGHVGSLAGDGAMAYFGYPRAHEDDPERAIRAGLAILSDCLNLREMEVLPAAEIAVRVGIDTGLVVAGTFSGHHEFDQDEVVGIAPNLAFKMQAAALPNTVVISSATRELTAGLFQCRARPALIVAGFDKPQSVWQVLRARTRLTRSWSARLQSVTPLVSREEEVAILDRRWKLAVTGEGQVALLSGEPGIGKSRIAATLKDRVAQQRHFAVTLQCSSQETDTAFHPIIHLLERIFGAKSVAAEIVAEHLGRILSEPAPRFSEMAPYLARLMDRASKQPTSLLDLNPEQIKHQTMKAIIQLLELMSEQRPVLLICEDIHWIDPTSEELLSLLVESVSHQRILLLATFRSGYHARWIGQSHVTLLALNRLTERQSATMITFMARDRNVTQGVIDRIATLADGVPLFIEELSRTVFSPEADKIKRRNDGRREADVSLSDASDEPTIPATLSDSLAARLDQLGTGREIAQVCSCIGRSFSAALVSKVANQDEKHVARALDGLVSLGLASVRGRATHAVYVFRHALIQESAHRSMLRGTRQKIHRRVAEVLAAEYADTSDGAPEILARHFEEAGALAEAIPHLHQAAQIAAARSANVEAVRLLERALRLLDNLPKTTERDSRELSLLVSLGPPKVSISGPGAPDVQQVYERAIRLCDELPSSQNHFAAHWGWWFTSRDNREALHRVNRLSSLTDLLEDDELALQAHHCQWSTQFCLGDHVRTSDHIARGLSIYERGDFRHHSTLYGGHDPKCCALGLGSLSLWLTGAYNRSLEWMEQAVAHAKSLQQSGSIRHSRDQEIMLHRFRCDAATVRHLAQEMASYAQQEGFKGLAVQAKVFLGWATAKVGDVDAGVKLIADALIEHTAINTPEDMPIYYEMAAEAYGAKGTPDLGLALLDEAISVAEQTGLQTWLAELFRRKGVLLLQQSEENRSKARMSFGKAIAIANSQHAQALLLRALCEDIRMVDGEERVMACIRLESLCDSLPEGHDYVDVVEARRLLREFR